MADVDDAAPLGVLLERVAENAARFAATPAGADDRARLIAFLEAHGETLMGTGAGSPRPIAYVVADERAGDARRRIDELLERAIAEHLAATRRRPRGRSSTEELTGLATALLEGLAIRPRSGGNDTPQGIAVAVADALVHWTEPDDALVADSEEATVEERVRNLDRRLAGSDPASPDALRLGIELMALAPASTLAFWRARHHGAALLARPEIRATELGDEAWTHAAEMLSMADGDRALAEEVARTTLARDPATSTGDRVALLRGAWLLLRLEWFDAARRHLDAFRAHGSMTPGQQTIANALQAYAYAATGPSDEAVALGRRATRGSGFGAQLGASAAARVLVRTGRYDEAREILAAAAPPRRPADIGATALLIARGTVAAYSGRPADALDDLLAAAEHLRRVGNRNPSGWPWVEPAVHALMQLDQPRRAAALVDAAHENVFRWGTPIVVAEHHRARARIATDAQAERAARVAVIEALAAGEAGLEHALAAAELDMAGDAPGGGGAEPLGGLTPRVREVAIMVADGLRDREIADRLHLSPRTVHRHVATALSATGARNRVDLARMVHGARDPWSRS